MHESWGGALVLCGAAALVAWLVPAVTRRAAEGGLNRNRLAGIRIPSTLASDRAWVAGHRAALPGTRRLLPVTLAGAVAVAVLLAAAGRTPLPFIAGLATVASQLIVLLLATRDASRAARAAEEDS